MFTQPQQMRASRVMGSASAPVANQASDKLAGLGARLEQAALVALRGAIATAGGSNAEVRVRASLRNVLEGTMAVEASWFTGRQRVAAKAELKVENGTATFDAKAFLASAAEAKHESPVEAKKTYKVEAALLRARRVGESVVLSHAALHEWGLRVPVADIQADKAEVEARIAASIQGYCLGSFYRNAEIVGTLAMPVVASEAVPAPVEAQPAPAAAHDTLKAETQALEASLQSAKDAPGKDSVTAGLSARQEISASIRSTLGGLAVAAALEWVSKQNPGSQPVSKGVDFTGLDASGLAITGSAVVSVEFYGHRSREQATIEVPFDGKGAVIKAKVGRTQADVLAAEEIRRRLQVTSDAEAKAMFDQFVKEETARQAILSGASTVLANGDMGYGSNWVKRGPADRIPIAKTALPEDFSKPGKKILIGGLVYELQPTDYNAPSIERAAHWMLELRADLPASKADFSYDSSGLGQALSSVGI
jgi:hypothetical protein